MAIKIDKKQIDGKAVLVLHGRVGEAEASVVQQAFSDVFDAGCYQVVVDLTEVDFMTSTGLGVLMMCMKQTREKSGFIRIASPQPLIRQILETTRLHRFLRIFPTVNAALQGGDPPTDDAAPT